MRQPRAARPRRAVRRWVITILLGIGLGVIGGLGYRILLVSHTPISALWHRPFGGQRFVRILVLGEDNTSKLRRNGHGLSDTIMVAAVDLDAKTVRAMSIPRDTRVDLTGRGAQKINAANAFGGPQTALQTVQDILGIQLDYYVTTDIGGLKNIVDLVGGVDIEVEKDMHYTDRRGGLRIDLKKGFWRLDGDKALQYVRFRHDALGDISRMQRQQKFLRALARRMVSPSNWIHLPRIVQEIYGKGYVETNMNLKDLQALARLARDVPQEKVVTETAPGGPETIDGISYYVIDREKTAEAVQRILQPAQNDSTAKVEVLNGAGIDGLAKEVADQLEKSGYVVTSTGNAPGFGYERSRIIVHNDRTSEAEVARLIGCTDVQYDHDPSTGSDITVIVGRDYRQ